MNIKDQSMQSKVSNQNFTIQELIKKVRRIEKLTDKMSEGKFESNHKIKQAENLLINTLHSARLSEKQPQSPSRRKWNHD